MPKVSPPPLSVPEAVSWKCHRYPHILLILLSVHATQVYLYKRQRWFPEKCKTKFMRVAELIHSSPSALQLWCKCFAIQALAHCPTYAGVISHKRKPGSHEACMSLNTLKRDVHGHGGRWSPLSKDERKDCIQYKPLKAEEAGPEVYKDKQSQCHRKYMYGPQAGTLMRTTGKGVEDMKIRIKDHVILIISTSWTRSLAFGIAEVVDAHQPVSRLKTCPALPPGHASKKPKHLPRISAAVPTCCAAGPSAFDPLLDHLLEPLDLPNWRRRPSHHCILEDLV